LAPLIEKIRRFGLNITNRYIYFFVLITFLATGSLLGQTDRSPDTHLKRTQNGPLFIPQSEKLRLSKFKQYIAAIHIQSNHSNGKDSIETIVKKAKSHGLSILIMTDTLIRKISYGLPPFRNVLSLSVSGGSLFDSGIDDYLDHIQDINDENSGENFLVIPGAEVSPFHYWEGSLMDGDLTVRDWRRHLHVIGLTKEEQYENLPVVYGGASTRYTRRYVFPFITFLVPFAIGLLLAFKTGYIRWVGIALAILGFLGVVNNIPFKSSKFSPYHGTYQHSPYQELIDAANAMGGYVIYSHPESNLVEEDVPTGGPLSFMKIKMKTPKYPNLIINTRNYLGFEGAYSKSSKIIYAGNQWDKALSEYLNRSRETPPWSVSGGDYHQTKEGHGWGNIDTGQTIFWLRSLSREDIFEALEKGRFYSVRQVGNKGYLFLGDYSLHSSVSSGQPAVSGEWKSVSDTMNLNLHLFTHQKPGARLKLTIIKNGKVVDERFIQTPYALTLSDRVHNEASGYYRIIAEGEGYQLITNPIFYKVTGERE
jgi:hypothetical protein